VQSLGDASVPRRTPRIRNKKTAEQEAREARNALVDNHLEEKDLIMAAKAKQKEAQERADAKAAAETEAVQEEPRKLSEYEQQRLVRVARNEERLKALGLLV